MAIGEIPVAVLFLRTLLSATCPVKGGFLRTSDSNDQLVR